MGLLHDARYGLRQLIKAPAFTITAILTLAIGVGANTAVFTLVHAVMLKSLPVADPARLYRVGDNDDCCVNSGMADDWGLFTYPAYLYFRDNTPAFEEMAAMQAWNGVTVAVRHQESSAAENMRSAWVSGNYFSTFGVGAVLGRTLTPQDDSPNAAPAVELSYRSWQRKFDGDPNIVGTTVTINGQAFTVVGVAAPGFFGDRIQSDPPDLWLPLAMEPMLRAERSLLKGKESSWLYIIGRMRPGANPKNVEAQLNVELKQWLSTEPKLTAEQRARIPKQTMKLGPGGGGIANLKRAYQEGLYMLTVASALVLLIACANLANLLLARATARRQQISIQMALGASRRRVVRTILTEAMQLSVLGGAAGLVVAYFGTKAMLGIVFRNARFVPISSAPSLPVLGFTLGVSILTGLLFGVVPAWLTSHASPIEALRGAGRSTRDHSALPQRLLVITQAALSVVLLVAAGLIGQSLRNLQNQKYGFETQNRYVTFFDPELAGYTPERLPALDEELQRRLMELPSVRNASFGGYTPQGQDNWQESVYLQSHPSEPGKEPSASWTRIAPRYFETLGVPLLRGRTITDQDTPTSMKVAVVNETFAKKLFPDGDALGQHFGRGDASHAADYEIVGVVGDAIYRDPTRPVRPMFFIPLVQTVQFGEESEAITERRSQFAHTIVLQVAGDVPGMEEKVRKLLSSINPNLTALAFRTYSEQVSLGFNQPRLLSRLTSVFSILAVLLAAVGLYGVTSYRVARRTSEIGIRMALGASPRDVVKMVLRGAFSQIGVGLIVGIPLAIAAGKMLSHKLYGVKIYDPVILGLAVAVLGVSAAVASAAPAHRAATVEPVQALRAD